MVDGRRMRPLNEHPYRGGPVVYWMNRDRRAGDNWALLAAQELAHQHKAPLGFVFVFSQKTPILWRELSFMVEGLRETELALRKKHIPFFLLEAGNRPDRILSFFRKHRVHACVTDFSPLREERVDVERLAKKVSFPVYEVDAHNIVPCWLASDHRESGLRTFRPKMEKFLPEFLSKIPRAQNQKISWQSAVSPADWKTFDQRLRVDRSVKPTDRIRSGESAALSSLRLCLNGRESEYASLLPYVRHGQLSAQRVAIETKTSGMLMAKRKKKFEAIVVREALVDNISFYD